MFSRNIAIFLIFILISFAGAIYLYRSSSGLPVELGDLGDKPEETDTSDENATSTDPVLEESPADSQENQEDKNFQESGYLTSGNPGQTMGAIYLVYEKPGAPALSKELVFNEKSYCTVDDNEILCLALSLNIVDLFANERVRVEGVESDGQVEVILIAKEQQ